MNYSYIMGIENISKLSQNNFQITKVNNNYEVIFPDSKIKLYEEFICDLLQNGFWNEYLGKEKVFIFKFKDGMIKKYTLNNENEAEVLKLCCEFADCKFESIDKMLRDNSFYLETYYKEQSSGVIIE